MDALIGETCGDDDALWERMTYQEVFDSVQGHLSNQKAPYAPRTFSDLQLLKQYTAQLLKEGEFHLGRVAASLLVAQSNHLSNNGKTLARRIRALFRHYQTFGGLPAETRGGKRNGRSYLDNEDVFQACRAWLTSQELGTVTPDDFRLAINTEILPRLLISTGKTISRTTTYDWLRRLGFYKSESKKGVYVDGHEREDVIRYRKEVFLPKINQILSYATQYEQKDDGTWEVIQPLLPLGVKRHVIYFHDESCFHGYDYKKTVWLDGVTKQQKMPGKSKGKLIHCSDFIGPEGRIRVSPSDEEYDSVLDARKIIYPGSNGDPWWDTKQLLAQLSTTLNIFEKKHLNCVAVLVFDQSSAHASHGEGALNAFEMNLTSGGKNKKPQNDTYFPPECTFSELRGQVQHLYNVEPDGTKVPKGVKQILQERECYIEKTKFKCTPRCPEPLSYPIPASAKPPCCLARILSNHKDFFEQRSAIETLIEGRGHKCLFLPKFHCELNPIEMYWGYAKAQFRQVKKTSFEHAKKEVVKALNACSTHTLRRFCNRTFRFMDAYSKGLSIKAAAWCVKKQSRHRTISEEAMKAFEEYEKGD
jgi:hypothetical protein